MKNLEVSVPSTSEDGIILRKEGNTMKYSKPDVSTLGDASTLIENITKGQPDQDSNGDPAVVPAYDLDE